MFDENVIQCFLDNQLQLYPEKVAETPEEAENFLEECMAVVVDSVKEVWEFLKKKVWIWKAPMRRKSWRRRKCLRSETADI